jgi:hypothetical protein
MKLYKLQNYNLVHCSQISFPPKLIRLCDIRDGHLYHSYIDNGSTHSYKVTVHNSKVSPKIPPPDVKLKRSAIGSPIFQLNHNEIGVAGIYLKSDDYITHTIQWAVLPKEVET